MRWNRSVVEGDLDICIYICWVKFDDTLKIVVILDRLVDICIYSIYILYTPKHWIAMREYERIKEEH